MGFKFPPFRDSTRGRLLLLLAGAAGVVAVAPPAGTELRPSWWPSRLPAGTLVTLLGNGRHPGGEDGLATAASMSFLDGGQVAWDIDGAALLVAEAQHHRARRITGINITRGGGRITTLAGADAPGFFGDGDAASAALLKTPMGIAGDRNGVYVSDSGNNVIRRVDLSSGVIETVAGTPGRPDLSVIPRDGCVGTNASFTPNRLAMDRGGALFIIANTCRVLRFLDGRLSLFAGALMGGCGGSLPYGDGGPATAATFGAITHVVAHDNAIFIVDKGARLVRRVDAGSRVVTTIAGSGGDGNADATLSGPAMSAALYSPTACAVAPDGTVYILSSGYRIANAMHIVDAGSRAIRALQSAWYDPMDIAVRPGTGEVLVGFRYQRDCIDAYNPTTGTLTRIAGTGSAYGGDGGGIADADIIEPVGAAIGPFFNLWVLSGGNQDTLSVVSNTTGTLSTLERLYISKVLVSAVAADERVCYADARLSCRNVGPGGARGASYAIAGGGSGSASDGSPALSAGLGAILGIARSSSGLLFFTATGAVRCVNEDGTLRTLIRGGGFSGDGGPASSASVLNPHGLVFGPSGELLIADSGNGRVRVMRPDGVVSTLAGGGAASGVNDDGDFGPATAAHLKHPVALALAPGGGTLFIAERDGHRVRAVSLVESAAGSTGVIYTVVGTGAPGFSGDRELALQARLNEPWSLHAAPWGDLLLSDRRNNRVRVLAPLTPCLGFMSPLLRGVCSNASDPRSLACAWGDPATGDGCRKCPDGALCLGGRLMRPRPGFYVASELSERAARCAAPAEARCVGWDARLRTTACGEGYRRGSPGCGACASGFYPARDGVCTVCPAGASPLTAVLYVFYLLLALAVFSLLLTLVARRIIVLMGGGTVGGVLKRSAQLLTWMFELFQVQVAVSSSFGPGLPPAPRAFYENLRIFSFDGLGPPPACTGGPFPAATGLYALVAFLLGLLVVLLLAGGRDGVVTPPEQETSDVAGNQPPGEASHIDEAAATSKPPSPWPARAVAMSGHLLTLVGLLYCAVASSTATVLACTPVDVTKAGYLALDGDGRALGQLPDNAPFDAVLRVHVLVGYPNVVCGEGQHPLMATWATIMLVVFLVGFPLLEVTAARVYTAWVMPARVGELRWAEARAREARTLVLPCARRAADASGDALGPVPVELLLRRPGPQSPRASVADVLLSTALGGQAGSKRAPQPPPALPCTATALVDATLPSAARGVAAHQFSGDLRASASWVAQVELLQLALLSGIGVAWVPTGELGADVARYVIILLSLAGIFALYWRVAPFKRESAWMAWAKLLHLALLLLTNLLGAVNSAVTAQPAPSAGLLRARDDLAYALLAFSIIFIVGLLAAFVRSLYVELAAAARREAAALLPLKAEGDAPAAAMAPPPSGPFRITSILGDPTGTTAALDVTSSAAGLGPTDLQPPAPVMIEAANPLFALRHERVQPPVTDVAAAAAGDLDPQPASPREPATEGAVAPESVSAPAGKSSRAQRSADAYGLRRAASKGRAVQEDVSSDHNVTIRYIGQQRIAVRKK